MAEAGSYPNASTLAGAERLVGDQGATTVNVTPAQIAAYVEAQDAANLAAAIATATAAAAASATAAATSSSAAAASASAAALSAGMSFNPVSAETADLKTYAQTTDNQIALITDSQDNPALAWDTTGYEFFDGPMSAPLRYAPSGTNFPLATADQVTLLTGGGYNGLICYGQSIAQGEDLQAETVLSTSQPYSNLTFANGPRSCTIPNTWGANQPTSGGPGTPIANGTSASAPLFETQYVPLPDGPAPPTGGYPSETPCSGAANYAVERAFIENQVAISDFVVFASAAGHGGATMATLQKGSTWYANFTDHVAKAKALATAAGKAYALHAVMWMQGENDIGAGTSYAAYKAALITLQANIQSDVQAITGQSEPVHLLLYQTAGGGSQSNPVDQVLPAQLDAANSSTRIHMVGPHFQLPNTTQASGLHLSPTGYLLQGRYMGRAYKQLVVEKRRPDWLNPVSAFAKGQTVYVRYNVPKGPIVLDTELVGFTQNYGFRIKDGTGDLTVTTGQNGLPNVRVSPSGHTIQIQVNRALGSSPVCRLGLDYTFASREATGVLGQTVFTHNVRDSTKESTIDPSGGSGLVSGGSLWFLSHWSPCFSLPITILDPNS